MIRGSFDVAGLFRHRKLLCLLGVICIYSGASSQIYINEVQAYNASAYLEKEWGNFPDWIELYNGGGDPEYLTGYFITDDPAIPNKWQLPSLLIYPGDFLLLFADNVSYRTHTNFSLDGEGDRLLLFTPEFELVDSVTFGKQFPDISYGRYPDGAGDWFYFEEGSPKRSNSDQHMAIPEFAGSPVFSRTGGIYQESLQVSLVSGSPGATIRYTTNGSDPDVTSTLYTTPIEVTGTTVIRARAFLDGTFSSPPVTNTYLLDREYTLPVVSLATDWKYIWDGEIGIYVEGTNGIISSCSDEPMNYNQDWERPVNVEYFDGQGTPGFNQLAGTKIFGACSRGEEQKSLSLFARSKYGDPDFDCKLFRDKDIDRFKSIVLRNSGNDIRHTMLRDGMMQNLVKDRMDLDYQEYQPAIVYLNGNYWGILNIREKLNEDYLAANHGVDPDSVDILEKHIDVVEGSDEDYLGMMDFIRDNDLSDPAIYAGLESRMDIDQFINYYLAEIYFFNQDWPAGNIKYWKPQKTGSRWRWLLYDLDFGFDFLQYTDNMVRWATTGDEVSKELFKELLGNEGFRNEFLQRFCSHMNTTFLPERVNAIIDSLAFNIEAEMPYHIDRFLWPHSMEDWYKELAGLTEFADGRIPVLKANLMERFSLEGVVRFRTEVLDPGLGSIAICGVGMPDTITGEYFRDIPVAVSAHPSEGYEFLGWEGASTSENPNIEIYLSDYEELKARFGPASLYSQLHINEVSSNLSNAVTDETGEASDWIEIYNSGNEPVQLAGMYLSDDPVRPGKFRIAEDQLENTLVYPDSFILFYADDKEEKGSLHLGFRLDNSGETVTLAQHFGNDIVVIDSVYYPRQSWGSTLSRIPDGSGEWKSSLPTPLGLNSAVPIFENLYINEFSASNLSLADEYGELDDWIEIFNGNNHAVNVGGLFLTDSLRDLTAYRIPDDDQDSTTIPAGGFLILWADNQPWQGILHLGFSLSREGEEIGLIQYDGSGIIDTLQYGKQYRASSSGRLPDGSGHWTVFPPTAGSKNLLPSMEGLYINEFSASNWSLSGDEYGEWDDWIEVYNENSYSVDVGGLFLTDSLQDPMRYRIPTTAPDSTTIPPGGYMLLWADKQPGQGVRHLDIALKREGEQIGLVQYNGLDYLDSLTFGPQYRNASSSLISSGVDSWIQVPPTPGLPNRLPQIPGIVLSEFSASNLQILPDDNGEFEDWIEIRNKNPYPVDLGGLFLSDSLGSKMLHRIPSTAPDSTTIQGNGYLVFFADGSRSEGILHLGFKLNRDGEQIILSSYDGISIVDSVTYGEQYRNASLSRHPDRPSEWTHLPPTPGTENMYVPVTGLHINEFASSNRYLLKDEYGESDDWIEIYNESDLPVDLGGLFITDSLAERTKFRIPTTAPDSTTVPAGGFKILWADNQANQGVLHLDFGLTHEGEQIGLLQYDGRTYIDSLSFPEFLINTSLSRYPDGTDTWVSMNATPGRSNTTDPFGKICINEFRAGKSSGELKGAQDENWIELYNNNEFKVNVGGLFLTNDLSDPGKYRIPDDIPELTTLPPKGFLLLWTDGQDYMGGLHLNFALDNQGSQIGLARKVDNIYYFIDTLVYTYQNIQVSTGRIKDGVNSWTHFTEPTPGWSNSSNPTGVYGQSKGSFRVFPNPVSGGVLRMNQERDVIFLDQTGRPVFQGKNLREFPVFIYPPGLYFLKTGRGEVVPVVLL